MVSAALTSFVSERTLSWRSRARRNANNNKDILNKSESREDRRVEQLTKELNDYLEQEEKWLTRAQEYRLDGNINLALSCMKIKKDYEKSVNLILEREGMMRDELDSSVASASSTSSASSASSVASEDKPKNKRSPFKRIVQEVMKRNNLNTSATSATSVSSDTNKSLNKKTSLKGIATTVVNLFKKKKTPEKRDLQLVVNLPPKGSDKNLPLLSKPPLGRVVNLPPRSRQTLPPIPTPQPPPRTRRSLKFGSRGSGSDSSAESSVASDAESFKRQLRPITKDLNDSCNKNDLVSGLLSSASSCDSDYDSEILFEMDRACNTSTPSEDFPDGHHRQSQLQTPPAKPPRTMLQVVKVQIEKQKEDHQHEKNETEDLIRFHCSEFQIIKEKEHRLHLQQQMMFDALAADEGIYSEFDNTPEVTPGATPEVTPGVTPVKQRQTQRHASLQRQTAIQHQLQRQTEMQHQLQDEMQQQHHVQDELQLQQQLILDSFVPTFAPPLQKSTRVSWDRNTDNWRQKREAVEKELEEVELEGLKEFFEI